MKILALLDEKNYEFEPKLAFFDIFWLKLSTSLSQS